MKYLANEIFYFVFNCVSLNHGKPFMQYGEPVPQAKTFIISLDSTTLQYVNDFYYSSNIINIWHEFATNPVKRKLQWVTQIELYEKIIAGKGFSTPHF